MKIKQLFYFLAGLFIINNGLCAQVSKINWQPTYLDIDGIPNDWTTNLRFYDSPTKISFEFRNDSNKLYFVLKSTDKSLYRQLQSSGAKLKFKINSQQKLNAVFTLLKQESTAGMPFPPQGEMDNENFNNKKTFHEPPGVNNSRMELSDEFRNNKPPMNRPLTPFFGKQPADTAVIKGFLNSKNLILSSENNNEKNIRFKKSPENIDEVSLELSIPLNELFNPATELNKIAEIPVSFQLIIPAASTNEQMRGPGGMGDGSRGGMGGPGGGMGGPGGGMGGPGGGGMSSNPMGGGPDGQMGSRPDMTDKMNKNQNLSKKTIRISFTLNNGE